MHIKDCVQLAYVLKSAFDSRIVFNLKVKGIVSLWCLVAILWELHFVDKTKVRLVYIRAWSINFGRTTIHHGQR